MSAVLAIRLQSGQSPTGPQPTFSGIHGDKVAGNFGTTIKPKFRA
ncbi:MAG: hypothetical protein WA085_19740 [Sphingobium sp.]